MCCAVHVDGVQSGVGALHLLHNIFRDTKNVRNVVAMPLVQMTPLLQQIQGLSAGNVQIDDGVGHAALGPHNQPFQVTGKSRL